MHDDSRKGRKVRASAALSAAAVPNARWNGFSSAGSFSIKLHLFLSLRNVPDASLISSYWPALLPLQFFIRIAVSILRVVFFSSFSLPLQRFDVSRDKWCEQSSRSSVMLLGIIFLRISRHLRVRQASFIVKLCRFVLLAISIEHGSRVSARCDR